MPKMVKLLDGSEFELDDALVRIQDAGTVVLNDDNAVFFQRQLEFIEAQTYDTLYPELEAREANQAHKKIICGEALKGLTDLGVDEELGKEILRAINKGLVPHVSIKF